MSVAFIEQTMLTFMYIIANMHAQLVSTISCMHNIILSYISMCLQYANINAQYAIMRAKCIRDRWERLPTCQGLWSTLHQISNLYTTGLVAPKGCVQKQIGKRKISLIGSCSFLNSFQASSHYTYTAALLVLHGQFPSQISMQINISGKMMQCQLLSVNPRDTNWVHIMY